MRAIVFCSFVLGLCFNTLLAQAEVFTPSFSGGPSLPLVRNWYIVNEILLEPGDELKKYQTSSQDFPGDFRKLSNEKMPRSISAFLVVNGLEPIEEGYEIGSQGVFSSYRLCVYKEDEPQLAKCQNSGTPSLDTTSHKPQIEPHALRFFPENPQENWIILYQIADHETVSGGFRYGAPSLVKGGLLSEKFKKEKYSNFLTLGFLMAIAAYSFMLWSRRPDDHASLALAALCFFTATRTLVASNLISYYFEASKLVFTTKYKIEYLTLIWMPMAYLIFIFKAFPEATSRRLTQFFGILCVGFSLVTPFIDTITMTKNLLYYQIFTLSVLVVGIISIARAWFKKIEGSGVALSGAVVVAFATVWDITVTFGVLPQIFLSQVSISFFMFLQGQVISSRFARAYRTTERLSESLKEEVSQQTQAIREQTSELTSVMENIPEGIIYIDDDEGELSELRSRYFEERLALGKKIDKIIEIFNDSSLTSDEKNQLQTVIFSAIGEDELNWFTNQDLLPHSFTSKKEAQPHIFEINWHPITEKDERISRILVTTKDVTNIHQARLYAQEKSIDNNRLIQIIDCKSQQLRSFFNTSKSILETLETHLSILDNDQASLEDFKTLYGNLHTLKGLSRSLKFDELSNLVHETEEPLFKLVKQQAITDITELQSLLKTHEFDQLLASTINTYLKYQALYQTLNEQWGGQEHSTTLAGFLSYLIENEFSIAEQLGKKTPKLKVNGGELEIHPKLESLLHQVFVHITRNSLDHGIELPSIREEKGKKPEGEITVDIKQTKDQIIIEFSDDGGGLSLGGIRAKAQQEAPQEPLEDSFSIVEFLFKEGFSSKDDVSQISGRGVGMGEVRRLIEEHSGKISIEPKGKSWKDIPVDTSTNIPIFTRICIPLSFATLSQAS